MKKENQTNNESEMLFGVYWDRHKLEIANNRGWDCKGDCGEKPQCLRACQKKSVRTETMGTLHDYNRYNHYVAAHLDKPISEISFMEVCNAIGAVRQEHGYSVSTAGGIASAVRRVFGFAYEHGDAANITDYTRGNSDIGLDLLVLLGSDRSEDYIREELRKERERLADVTKSLTIWQMEKLSSILWEGIEEDGRYCLMCLMLYAGVRPAEGRALRWKDIVPFVDHPGRHVINVFNLRDGEGNLKPRLKTDNAYRRIPIHIELEEYLEKRRKYVVEHTTGPIDELPICCFGNEFDRACRDYEAAALAQKVFVRLYLSKEDFYVYQIERLSERYEHRRTRREDDEDQHITLYALRRNFWTWLQSSTRLTDGDKRLIMGHELPEGQMREDKNDENLLWNICREMDGCVISKMLHEQHLVVDLDKQDFATIDDQGGCRIHLSEEMLAAGVNLCISATAEEPGEAIRLKALTPVRSVGGISPHAHVVGVPPKSRNGINCQLENWQAHQKPVRPRSEKTKNQDE